MSENISIQRNYRISGVITFLRYDISSRWTPGYNFEILIQAESSARILVSEVQISQPKAYSCCHVLHTFPYYANCKRLDGENLQVEGKFSVQTLLNTELSGRRHFPNVQVYDISRLLHKVIIEP